MGSTDAAAWTVGSVAGTRPFCIASMVDLGVDALTGSNLGRRGRTALSRISRNPASVNGAPIATDTTDGAGNVQILAGKWIDIYGDFGDADAGVGTIMNLHGTITPGPLNAAPRSPAAPTPARQELGVRAQRNPTR